MSDRRCGYCREFGHNGRKCEIRLGQIDNVLRHIGGERVELINLLAANGIGLGTILGMRTWDGIDRQYVITTLDRVYHQELIDYRNHRYRKSVRVTMRSWSGKIHGVKTLPEDYCYTSSIGSFVVPCRALDDMSERAYATFYLNRLDVKPSWCEGQERMYYYQSQPQILSPSSDIDLTMDDLRSPVVLHTRLTMTRNTAAGIPILPA